MRQIEIMATSDEALRQIEVDDRDADSGLGDIASSSFSQSVRSSVYEFIEENGRTYHKYKEGRECSPTGQDGFELK